MKRRKNSRKKKLLAYALVALAVAMLGTTWYFVRAASQEDAARNRTRASVYPSLYSDTHITHNAIASDPRFRGVALLDPKSFVANALGALTISKTPARSEGLERGTWLWTPLLEITPEYRATILEGAAENGIRTIYLSIDSYLDIYVMPEGPEKDARIRAFDDALRAFIREANALGLSVDAEGGWRNWAEEGNEYKPAAIVEYAIRFNETYPEKLRGFQYDVEPYLLEAYWEDKRPVLKDFVGLIDDTVTKLRGSDLLFSVVIPDFYDGDAGETPRFLYRFKYQHTLDHLLDVLERRPESALIIMAYRNESGGENGSIAISKRELELAEQYQTKVIVAQETGDFPPPYITFFGTSRARLDAELRAIESTFLPKKSYDGYAIHYINAFLELN